MSLQEKEGFDQPPHRETFAPFQEGFLPPAHAMKLSDAPKGSQLKVLRLGASRADALKLRALGLTTDRPLSIFEGGGTRARILSVGYQRIAIGYDLAQTILVEEVAA